MSFSLYLLHTLFLASFSTIAYVTAGGKLAGIIAAAIAFLLAAAIPVFLLTSFDQWWLRVLARIRIFVRET
jgi:peptidoglycan/LPS O-acetylase OafA/YrhL